MGKREKLETRSILFTKNLSNDSQLKTKDKEYQAFIDRLKLLSPSSNICPQLYLSDNEGVFIRYGRSFCFQEQCDHTCYCRLVDSASIDLRINSSKLINCLISHLKLNLINSAEIYQEKFSEMNFKHISLASQIEFIEQMAEDETKESEEYNIPEQERCRVYDPELIERILKIKNANWLHQKFLPSVTIYLEDLCDNKGNFEAETIWSDTHSHEEINNAWIKEETWQEFNNFLEDKIRSWNV